MLNNNFEYKYEMPCMGPFVITGCFTNGKVSLKYGAMNIRYNIHGIKPYTSDTNVEDINI